MKAGAHSRGRLRSPPAPNKEQKTGPLGFQAGRIALREKTNPRVTSTLGKSEWRDLNPRPLGPEPSALPAALHPDKRRRKNRLSACSFKRGATQTRTGGEDFADPCLTTWLWRRTPVRYALVSPNRTPIERKFGASDEARTRYLHLGKVALYQMSYTRIECPGPESNQRHEDFQSSALPTELPGHMRLWRRGWDLNPRPPA